jgi:hypothetical protein
MDKKRRKSHVSYNTQNCECCAKGPTTIFNHHWLPNPLTLNVKMEAPMEHGFTKLKYIVLDDLMDLVDVDI